MSADRTSKLVNKTTGAEITIGDTVNDFRGDAWIVRGFTPPHKPSSSGRVLLENPNDGGGMRC